jgi:hypothetical protein
MILHISASFLYPFFLVSRSDQLRIAVHLHECAHRGGRQGNDECVRTAWSTFKQMWSSACTLRDIDFDMSQLEIRASHVSGKLEAKKDLTLRSVLLGFHSIEEYLDSGLQDVVLDNTVSVEDAIDPCVLLLNKAWQFAHIRCCGVFAHDLGVYILRDGVLVYPSKADRKRPSSCHICMLDRKVTYDKPESFLTSAWGHLLQCPCQSTCVLHGPEHAVQV